MTARHLAWHLTASTAKVCCLPQLVWLFDLVFMPMGDKNKKAVVQDLKLQAALLATERWSNWEDRSRIHCGLQHMSLQLLYNAELNAFWKRLSRQQTTQQQHRPATRAGNNNLMETMHHVCCHCEWQKLWHKRAKKRQLMTKQSTYHQSAPQLQKGNW